MNALFSRLTKKTLIVATIAISFGVAGGLAILSTTGDVTAAGPAMSPGFIKGPNPAKADPAMVDAGKKIYFRKCVWCHGVDGAGDGPHGERRTSAL